MLLLILGTLLRAALKLLLFVGTVLVPEHRGAIAKGVRALGSENAPCLREGACGAAIDGLLIDTNQPGMRVLGTRTGTWGKIGRRSRGRFGNIRSRSGRACGGGTESGGSGQQQN